MFDEPRDKAHIKSLPDRKVLDVSCGQNIEENGNFLLFYKINPAVWSSTLWNSLYRHKVVLRTSGAHKGNTL